MEIMRYNVPKIHGWTENRIKKVVMTTNQNIEFINLPKSTTRHKYSPYISRLRLKPKSKIPEKSMKLYP